MGKLLEYIKQPVFDNWYTGEKVGQGVYSEVYILKIKFLHLK